MESDRLPRVLAAIDAANSEDADCLRYGRQMSAVLAELESNPSDALAIAVRAQHIRRFEIPRASYPTGKVGYKRWRTDLGKFHADLAARLTLDAGYDDSTAARVTALVRKLRLGTDPEVQCLEDVACIVFVREQLEDFATKHPRPKLLEIIRKTLAKMSRRGRERAMAGTLSDEVRELLEAASALS